MFAHGDMDVGMYVCDVFLYILQCCCAEQDLVQNEKYVSLDYLTGRH